MVMPGVTYAAVVLMVTGAAIYAVIVYNGLVRLQNEIGRAWANIDVLLKQRHDEVPNLVACVKGYMDYERQTLEAVTQARTASMNAVDNAVSAYRRWTAGIFRIWPIPRRGRAADSQI